MADARALLRKEREARRIAHPQATYSTTGKLICLICQLQLKSESLWNSHLRSPQHLTCLQRYEEEQASAPAPALEVADANTPESGMEDVMPNKKRKAAHTLEEEEGTRKKNKSGTGHQEFLGEVQMKDHQEATPRTPSPLSTELPSRPTSVPPPPPVLDANAMIDEDEWAAFEKDIAVASLPVPAEATISAPALSAADLEKQAAEESYAERKTRLEAELEGEKEDAARKLEEEFDDMKGFEERVRKLKEKRDALRANASNTAISEAIQFGNGTDTDRNGIHSGDEDEESSDEEDDWDGFRLKF